MLIAGLAIFLFGLWGIQQPDDNSQLLGAFAIVAGLLITFFTIVIYIGKKGL